MFLQNTRETESGSIVCFIIIFACRKSLKSVLGFLESDYTEVTNGNYSGPGPPRAPEDVPSLGLDALVFGVFLELHGSRGYTFILIYLFGGWVEDALLRFQLGTILAPVQIVWEAFR